MSTHINIRFPSSIHIDALVRAFGTVLGYGPDESGNALSAEVYTSKMDTAKGIPSRSLPGNTSQENHVDNGEENECYYGEQCDEQCEPWNHEQLPNSGRPWEYTKRRILLASSRTHNFNEEYEQCLRNRRMLEFDFVSFNKVRS